MRYHRMIPAGIFAFALLAACSKKAPETAPAPAVNADSIAKARAADSAAAAAKARDDSIAKAKADSVAKVQAGINMLTMGISTSIYFAFDKSDLTDSDKVVLDKKIEILNAQPSLYIQIAGNTDERGSAEYNLALGQRRAAAAKRYLTDHGIADSRITIISYGLERPVALGHDEQAWALNRRDEFTITAGQFKFP